MRLTSPDPGATLYQSFPWPLGPQANSSLVLKFRTGLSGGRSQTLELGWRVCGVTDMLPLTLPLGFSSESLLTPTPSVGPLAVSPTYQHCLYRATLDCSGKVLHPDIPMAFHQVLPSNITLSEGFPPAAPPTLSHPAPSLMMFVVYLLSAPPILTRM